MSPALCRRVLESPDVRGAVEEARINDTINMLECDRLVSTDTLKAAVSLLSDIISGSIEATTGQRIKAAQILMDREPTRRYTKTSRVENYSTRMEVDLDAVLERVIGDMPHPRKLEGDLGPQETSEEDAPDEYARIYSKSLLIRRTASADTGKTPAVRGHGGKGQRRRRAGRPMDTQPPERR